MPTVPTYESRVIPQGADPFLPTRPVGDATAITQVADLVADVTERAARAQTEAEKALALVSIQRDLGNLRTGIERDGDTNFGTRAARFEEGSRRLIAERARAIGGTGRGSFAVEAGRLAAGQQVEVQRQAWRDQEQHHRAALDAVIENAAITLANPQTTPQDREVQLAQVRDAFGAARGIINPVWLTNAEQRFRRTYSTNLTIAWANQSNPARAYSEMTSGRISDPQVAAAYANMSPQEQLNLRRTVLGMAAEQQRMANEGRAAQERAARAQVDAATQDFVTARLAGDEQAQAAALDRLARTPGGGERRNSLATTFMADTERGVRTDPITRTQLEVDLQNGRLTQQRIADEVAARRLSFTDAQNLFGRLGAQSDSGFNNALSFMRASLNVPGNYAMLPNPTDRQREAAEALQRAEAQLREAWSRDRGMDVMAEARRLVETQQRTIARLGEVNAELRAMPEALRSRSGIRDAEASATRGRARYAPEQVRRATELLNERERLLQ